LKALLWLGAMVLSLPLLIASFRKLQAMAMLISEVSVTREAAGEKTLPLRAIVSGTIVAVGCGGLMLFVLVLSSAILPSRNALIVAGLLVAIAAIILWRWFIRLYSRAQIALRETLERQPVADHVEESAPLPALLHEASLQMVSIGVQSVAAGKLIGELRLRTETGASIVGIERDSQNLINPGPDEEIIAGDRVLLLGTKQQLESADTLLVSKA
jgi:CPA2 family monovalent cation:H+ antiporter-2